MNSSDRLHYNHIHNGGTAYYKQLRGLICVYGSEAVQFLDGMITNDVKTLADGAQMRAAFPDAKGRLIALTRVARLGERYMVETEEATHQKVYETLERFTAAGDFKVEDMSDEYRFLTVWDRSFIPITPPFIEYDDAKGADYFVHREDAADFIGELKYFDAAEITASLYDSLRIERGIPVFGRDMDDTTIVPELGLTDMISYTKGCYVGQEIIARIHFRGHVAKSLTGIMTDIDSTLSAGVELFSEDGKNAGRVASVTMSPKLDKTIALAYVRYEHLSAGTKLKAGETEVEVASLPFV